MTMASVGSVVQAASGKAREGGLARGGGSDLTDATRRIGQPVEASAEHYRPPPAGAIDRLQRSSLLIYR